MKRDDCRTMKFWTTQTEEVLKYILNNGIYKPDFKLSKGLGSEEMKIAYNNLLSEYQSRNAIKCRGLVFGISHLDDILVNNIEQYRDYFLKNTTFWDSVSSAGECYSTLELELSDELDLIPIYFQDFIILGMRSLKKEDFTNYVKSDLVNEVFHNFSEDLQIAQSIGWTDDYSDIYTEPILNRIMQVHMHEILIDNIVNVYPTIDFETREAYELGETANQLKDIINSKK